MCLGETRPEFRLIFQGNDKNIAQIYATYIFYLNMLLGNKRPEFHLILQGNDNNIAKIYATFIDFI